MRSFALPEELGVASAQVTAVDLNALADLGIPPIFLLVHRQMVGLARVRVTGDLYEPDQAGKWAYITPACGHYPDTPYTDLPDGAVPLYGEITDLVCWDSVWPRAWALRNGDAEWLGAVERNDPTHIRRSPLAWLRAGGDGLVLLTRDRFRQYDILQRCNDIVAEDDLHADELDRLLVNPAPRRVYLASEVLNGTG